MHACRITAAAGLLRRPAVEPCLSASRCKEPGCPLRSSSVSSVPPCESFVSACAGRNDARVVTAGEPIRVLHIITSLTIGGAERLVVSAAKGLPAARFEQAICVLTERGPLAAEAEASGVPVFCVGAFPGLRNPLAFVGLVRTIRAFRPAIVHTHLQSANLYGRLAAW